MKRTRPYSVIVKISSEWYGTVQATSKPEATRLAQEHFDEGKLQQLQCGEKTESIIVFEQRTRSGSWSTFERRFRPKDGPNGAVYWHREQLPKDIDPHHVWTIVDCDGHLYVTPGYRFVNRIDYVVTEVPWTDEDQHQPDYLYD